MHLCNKYNYNIIIICEPNNHDEDYNNTYTTIFNIEYSILFLSSLLSDIIIFKILLSQGP